MRYSNIDPLQESNIGSPPELVNNLPRANQLSCGNFPCAIPTKIPNLASDASKS
jgi:hypothetical protein